MDLRRWHGSLPTFTDQAHLLASTTWHRYAEAAFGLSTLTFPLDLRRLNFFYLHLLPEHDQAVLRNRPVLGAPRSPPNTSFTSRLCLARHSASSPGHARAIHEPYVQWGGSDPSFGANHVWTYLWNSAGELVHELRNGVPSDSWVEVHRCGDRHPTSRSSGSRSVGDLWMYLARGSGVHYNVGRTLVARDKAHLQRLADNATRLKDAFEWARARSFDSVQLTHSLEQRLYKYEIVDLRLGLSDDTRCPPAASASASAVFRAGWRPHEPCTCALAQPCLHCRESVVAPSTAADTANGAAPSDRGVSRAGAQWTFRCFGAG